MPSEAEWEKAKQGTDGQLPGVDINLKGNVWEWTRSLGAKMRMDLISSILMILTTRAEDLGVYGLRVVRGWAKRLGRYPNARDEFLGFRLVLSPYSISDFRSLPQSLSIL